jgi:hypothetical protein
VRRIAIHPLWGECFIGGASGHALVLLAARSLVRIGREAPGAAGRSSRDAHLRRLSVEKDLPVGTVAYEIVARGLKRRK